MLSRQLGRPVLDRTGLVGQYNFELKWRPDERSCPEQQDDSPSIFAALEEQLGLKLDATKAPMDMLVIDHAERPDEN